MSEQQANDFKEIKNHKKIMDQQVALLEKIKANVELGFYFIQPRAPTRGHLLAWAKICLFLRAVENVELVHAINQDKPAKNNGPW